MDKKLIREAVQRHHEAMLALARNRYEVYGILRTRLGTTTRANGADILQALADVPKIDAEVASTCRKAVKIAKIVAGVERDMSENSLAASAYAERALIVANDLDMAIENLSEMRKLAKEDAALTVGLDLAIELAESGKDSIYDAGYMAKVYSESEPDGGSQPPKQTHDLVDDVLEQALADLEGTIHGAYAGYDLHDLFLLNPTQGAVFFGEAFTVLWSGRVAWKNTKKYWFDGVIHGPLDPNGPIYWPPRDPDNRPTT